MIKIALCSDHAGYELKETIKIRLAQKGYELVDVGTQSAGRVDYVPYTLEVVQLMAAGICDRGIFFCGNGFAMAMLANRFPGMRAAVCHDVFTARTAREMGNANCISLGARVVGVELAWDLTNTWLKSEFLGETVERYARRQQQLAAVEQQFIQADWQDKLKDYLSK